MENHYLPGQLEHSIGEFVAYPLTPAPGLAPPSFLIKLRRAAR
jgi:hypothetical protein